MRHWLAAIAILGLVSPLLFADERPNPAASDAYFETHIRPLLANHCQGCHGAKQQKGGLRLDSREAALAGGESGSALAPGKPTDSLLIEAVAHTGAYKMPPKGKLKADEIARLHSWVQAGAHWPTAAAVRPADSSKPEASGVTVADRNFWAFRKPVEPPIPSVQRIPWVQSPIDAFILSKLEGAKLSPAPPADKRTLIRRATYDLTGLAPTPAEVKAFLADDSPEAFAKVVDRLLASPRYGERWGRHWLDVARYADSNGMDENLAFEHAYRYRDWVVDAFNRDLPYDQFVRDQIAGDLAATSSGGDDEAARRLAATGFLSIGPKMLAEDDPVKMQMDIVDEQIDATGRAFLGLTLGCARCHDHKFDPIPTADYYSLAGIFKSTKTMDNFTVVAKWHERPLWTTDARRRDAEFQKKLADAKSQMERARQAAVDSLVGQESAKLGKYLAAAAILAAQPRLESPEPKDAGNVAAPGSIVLEAEQFTRGTAGIDKETYGAGIGIVYNIGKLPNVAEYDVTLPKGGFYQIEIRYAAAESRPIVISVDGKVLRDDAVKNPTGSWNPESQIWSAEAIHLFPTGKSTIVLQRSGPFPHIDKVALTPRPTPEGIDLATYQTPQQLAAKEGLLPQFLIQWTEALSLAKAKPDSPLAKWLNSKESPARQFETMQRLLASAAGKPAEKRSARESSLWNLVHDAKGPFSVGDKLESMIPADEAVKIKSRQEDLAKIEKAAPPIPVAMAVQDGKGESLRIHIRGNHLTLGKEVPRQFPRVIAGDNQHPVTTPGSGRLELAQWITSPDHPLTSRVMVNRLWQGHFGEGLVRSPDNFGRLGEKPSHPDLLDWLARRFVDSGWSVKHMHRLMMLTSAYQSSTAYSATAALADPENRLLWRQNRRRLEVEAIRDSVLQFSGRLDATMGGSMLGTANRAYVTGTASVNPTRYDTGRRSVYLPVVRSAVYEVFQAFDFADPSVSTSRRDNTTVAPQALFMLNSPLMLDESRRWAERLIADAISDESRRVDAIYESALCRPATPTEIRRAIRFIRSHVAQQRELKADPKAQELKAWQAFCRAVLASNEFVYVE